MKILKLFILATILFTGYSLSAQVAITNDGSSAATSAMLEVKSTNKGFLPPRVADTNAISSPVAGLIIYDNSCNCLRYYNGSLWSDCIGTFTPIIPPVVTNPTTGKIWMDRNLGASRQATGSTDTEAYGDLYQWGRQTDGHEKRNSSTYDGDANGLATTSDPNQGNPWDGKFITTNASATNYNWLQNGDDNLWQGATGVNNPCRNGFRLPTQDEWNAEHNSWSSQDAAGAYGSPLKLTMAGYRYPIDGSFKEVGTDGWYWSSSTITINGYKWSYALNFDGSSTGMHDIRRGDGCSVRCIKD